MRSTTKSAWNRPHCEQLSVTRADSQLPIRQRFFGRVTWRIPEAVIIEVVARVGPDQERETREGR
jgi:hypothetical protein